MGAIGAVRRLASSVRAGDDAGGGRSAAAGRSAVAARARRAPGRCPDPRWPDRHWRGARRCAGRRRPGRRAAAGVHRCPRPSRLDSPRLAVPPTHRRVGPRRADQQRSCELAQRRRLGRRAGNEDAGRHDRRRAPRRSAATPKSTPTVGSSGWRECWRPGRRTLGGPTCRWSRSRSPASSATRVPPTCSTPPCGQAPTSSAASIRAPTTVIRSPISTSCSASPNDTASASTSTSTRPESSGRSRSS